MIILEAVNFISPCFTLLRNASQVGETIYDARPERAGVAQSAARAYVITEAAVAALDISSTVYWLAGMAILPMKCVELGLRCVNLGIAIYLNATQPDERRKQQIFLTLLNIARLLVAIAVVTLLASSIASIAPPALATLAFTDVAFRAYLWMSN